MRFVIDWRETVAGDIHVRTEDRNAHGFAFSNEMSDFFGISKVVG